MKHQDITGEFAVHPAAFIQDSDPGAVGADKLWIDTTSMADIRYKIRNGANDAWVDHTPATGATEMGDLSDVDLTGLAAGDMLEFDGADFVAITAVHELDQLDDVNAPTPSDGDVLTWDDGGGEWVPSAPSGGGLPAEIFEPRTAPSSPSSRDDEFTASSLDAKWTQIGSVDAGLTVTPNKNGTKLSIEGPGAASNNVLLVRQTLGTEGDAGVAFQVTAKFSISSRVGTIYCQFQLGDNSTYNGGNYVTAGLYCPSGVLKAIHYDGSLTDLALGVPATSLWVHYQRTSGNSVTIWLSGDGENFQKWMGPTSRTWNADYLFLYLGGGGTSEGFDARCDFVRVNDSRFTQRVV